MVWWQELLVCIGAAALGIILGILVGNIVFKVWTWFDSQKRKPSISDNGPNKFDILVKESRNRYREGIQVFTVPVKSEGQTSIFVYENIYPITKQETNLPSNHCPEEIIKPAVREKDGQPTQKIQKRERKIREIKIEREAANRARGEETPLLSKEGDLQVPGEAEEQAKQEATVFIKEMSQRMAELAASARKFEEAKAKILIEIERLSREEAVQAAGEVAKKAEQEAEIVRETQEVVTAGISGQTPSLNEIETNLRIATTPWDGKPLPFQTKIWDTKMVEFDSLVTEHSDDLGQAYIDMAMANQIVWLCNDIGYTSNDLEASYKQLCTKITERLATVYGKRHATCHA